VDGGEVVFNLVGLVGELAFAGDDLVDRADVEEGIEDPDLEVFDEVGLSGLGGVAGDPVVEEPGGRGEEFFVKEGYGFGLFGCGGGGVDIPFLVFTAGSHIYSTDV